MKNRRIFFIRKNLYWKQVLLQHKKGVYKSGMDFSIPPKGLFFFECSNFLQIGKTIRVASEVDVLALHVVGPQIQPEILI